MDLKSNPMLFLKLIFTTVIVEVWSCFINGFSACLHTVGEDLLIALNRGYSSKERDNPLRPLVYDVVCYIIRRSVSESSG